MLLSRRVQLAVLAHIRHTHTRYDNLLKETSWQNARRVVEPLCLDILVKWRGDEETGRDQLDEILREVVVISDSDSEESEDDAEASNPPVDAMQPRDPREQPVSTQIQAFGARETPQTLHANGDQQHPRQGNMSGRAESPRAAAKKEQRGFKRYRAWEDAIRRNREPDNELLASQPDRTIGHRSDPYYGESSHDPRPEGFVEAAGSIPQPNGFVPRRTQPDPLQAPYSRPVDFSLARPRLEEVTSNTRAHERRTTPASRHNSPPTDRLQDMLVRSIEPVSPGTMQPSFVRTLPPRSRLSPVQRPAPYRIGSVSPARGAVSRERPVYVERRVVSDRPMFESSSQRHYLDGYGHQSSSRRYDAKGPIHSSAMPNDVSRAHETGPTFGPRGQRITVGFGQPGDQSKSVLMEDRGGFFERVDEQPRPTYDAHSDVGMVPLYRPHQSVGLPPESQRVVSWEEGSRIYRSSRYDQGVEVIPASEHRVFPLEARPHMAQMDSRMGQHPYDPRSQRVRPEANHFTPYQGQPAPPAPSRHQLPLAPAPPRQGLYV